MDSGPYIPSFYQDCSAVVRSSRHSEVNDWIVHKTFPITLSLSPSPLSLSLSLSLSQNLLMQQPLCHLYFATLMEHLMDEPQPRDVNSLVRLAGTLTQVLFFFSPSSPPLSPLSLPSLSPLLLIIESLFSCLL